MIKTNETKRKMNWMNGKYNGIDGNVDVHTIPLESMLDFEIACVLQCN